MPITDRWSCAACHLENCRRHRRVTFIRRLFFCALRFRALIYFPSAFYFLSPSIYLSLFVLLYSKLGYQFSVTEGYRLRVKLAQPQCLRFRSFFFFLFSLFFPIASSIAGWPRGYKRCSSINHSIADGIARIGCTKRRTHCHS